MDRAAGGSPSQNISDKKHTPDQQCRQGISIRRHQACHIELQTSKAGSGNNRGKEDLNKCHHECLGDGSCND
jgi:hypothetical protein